MKYPFCDHPRSHRHGKTSKGKHWTQTRATVRLVVSYFNAENLWNVQGYRVYLLAATRDAPEATEALAHLVHPQSEQGNPAKRPVRRSRSISSIEVR